MAKTELTLLKMKYKDMKYKDKLDEVATKFYFVDDWTQIKQAMKSSVDMLLAEANS